jgi:DNA-binding CsgD family transcriptional regulator
LEKAEQLILLAQSSGALGSQARVTGAETVLLLARSQMGRSQRSWEEYRQRADEAESDGEHIVFNSSMVSAGFEALAKHPERTREMMDGWARNTSLPFMGRVDGLALAAMATFRLRDLDDTVKRASEILRLAEQHDSVLYIGRSHVWLAAVHVLRNETVDADRCIRVAVEVFWNHGIRFYLCEALEVYALLAARCHDVQEATRVLGAVARLRGEMQSPLSFDANLMAEATVIATEALGDQYESVFAAGAALTDEELIAFIDRTRGSRGRPTLGWNSLTPTELQVADLVRLGSTNKQIAASLLMGTETVKTHVSHIFTKLGLSNRSQLATIATAQQTRSDTSKDTQ